MRRRGRGSTNCVGRWCAPIASCWRVRWKSMSHLSGVARRVSRAHRPTKCPVMIAVENLGTQVNRKLRLGRVRLGVADAPGSKQLVDFARTTVAPGLADPHRRCPDVSRLRPGGLHPPLRLRLQLARTRIMSPCPDRIASRRCLNGGTLARITIASNASTCSSTSTSSPSDSIVAGQRRAGMLFYRLLQQSVQHRSPPAGRPHRRHHQPQTSASPKTSSSR